MVAGRSGVLSGLFLIRMAGWRERSVCMRARTVLTAFACHKYWSPVGLMAEYWDCSRAEAAERMCRLTGVVPPDWRERWEELQYPVPLDTASLAEALKMWCGRVYGPAWVTAQFEAGLAEPLASCLGVLSLVTTRDAADEWLAACKGILGPLLENFPDGS